MSEKGKQWSGGPTESSEFYARRYEIENVWAEVNMFTDPNGRSSNGPFVHYSQSLNISPHHQLVC